jgi:molecular chaperone GrpE
MNKKKSPKETDANNAEMEALMEEKAELNDRFLRFYSEFENYKKRTNKEKIDLIATASEKVILGLLPVIDDFERAIQHNQNIEDITVLKEGFELIYNKLLALLKRFEVEEIIALGETFDTDLHEAITHLPSQSEDDKGKIMDVTQKGYKLKDKVIRFAKVVVAN